MSWKQFEKRIAQCSRSLRDLWARLRWSPRSVLDPFACEWNMVDMATKTAWFKQLRDAGLLSDFLAAYRRHYGRRNEHVLDGFAAAVAEYRKHGIDLAEYLHTGDDSLK